VQARSYGAVGATTMLTSAAMDFRGHVHVGGWIAGSATVNFNVGTHVQSLPSWGPAEEILIAKIAE
jgi:hypothetical protein